MGGRYSGSGGVSREQLFEGFGRVPNGVTRWCGNCGHHNTKDCSGNGGKGRGNCWSPDHLDVPDEDESIINPESTLNTEIARLNTEVSGLTHDVLEREDEISRLNAVIQAMAEWEAERVAGKRCCAWPEHTDECDISSERCKQCIIDHFTRVQEAKDAEI